jgi:hypothetical protein
MVTAVLLFVTGGLAVQAAEVAVYILVKPLHPAVLAHQVKVTQVGTLKT